MEKQLTGDQKTMAKNPIESPSANPKGGQMQLTGEQVKLGRSPVASPSANPSGGEKQLVGDVAPLNRAVVKGWGSAAKLPMSPRAIAQSNTK